MKLRLAKVGRGNRDPQLSSGSLYLVGGRVYAISSYGRPSFFSLQTGVWSRLPIPEPVLFGSDHAGDVVGDKIYITGGEGVYSVVEYDLLLESTSSVETYGDTVGPTNRKSMTALYAEWRREIIFFGGFTALEGLDEELAELEGDDEGEPLALSNETHCLNVESKSWQLLQMKGALPEPRTGHSAAIDGFNMYVYGGYNEAIGYLRDIWVAHLHQRKRPHWTMPRIEGMVPPGRIRATLNSLKGYLVLFGGVTMGDDVRVRTDLYCPRTNVWKTGISGDQNNPNHVIEIVGSCSRYQGYPVGVEVVDGVLIFTSSDVNRISITYDFD